MNPRKGVRPLFWLVCPFGKAANSSDKIGKKGSRMHGHTTKIKNQI